MKIRLAVLELEYAEIQTNIIASYCHEKAAARRALKMEAVYSCETSVDFY
jgi:hypothetical protein